MERQQVSQTVSAIRGALWLVDHDPETDVSEDQQNERIQDYLAEHGHYCFDGRGFKPENLRRMDLKRFRMIMSEIVAKNKCQDTDELGPGVLWKLKSRGLSQRYLTKYGYDRKTFTEADLPGPPRKLPEKKLSSLPETLAAGEISNVKPATDTNDTTSGTSEALHSPIRRSQLICILDVEQALIKRSDKYKNPATRTDALLLLIKQYSLTWWDRKTSTIRSLDPTKLITSLSNAFHTRDSERNPLAQFWSNGCHKARATRKFLQESRHDIKLYETSENLPSYGRFSFVSSGEDVKLALSETGYGDRANDVQLQKMVSQSGKVALVTSTLSSSESGSTTRNCISTSDDISQVDKRSEKPRGVCHWSRSRLLTIKDIDKSKVDCDHQDYKYGTRARRLRTLKLNIRRHALQRWDKDRRAILDMTAEKLYLAMEQFFHRHSSMKADFSSAELWREGSRAFGEEAMAKLRDEASRLEETNGLVEADASTNITLSTQVEADLSGLKHEVISTTTYDDDGCEDSGREEPPSKLSRKRNAKVADLRSRSSSKVSRYEQDADFVPSAPPSPMDNSRVFPPLLDPIMASRHFQRLSAGQASAIGAGSQRIPFEGSSAEIMSLRHFTSSNAGGKGFSRLNDMCSGEDNPQSKMAFKIQEESSPKSHSFDISVSGTDQRETGSDGAVNDNSLAFSSAQSFAASKDIDLRSLGSKLMDLSSYIRNAVSCLFKDLALAIATPNPCPKTSDERLMVLFRRLWGGNWEEAHPNMANRTAYDVMKALIAAFLFESVFKDETSWQVDIFKDLGLSLPGRQEIEHAYLSLATMDWDQMLETQRQARKFVARSLLNSGRDHGDKLTESFMLIVHGHIATLASVAQIYRPSQRQIDEVAVEEAFRIRLISITQKATRLKLKLSQSASNHRFVWPTPGDRFNPAEMESVYPLQHDHEDQVVDFALFPSLSVQVGSCDQLARAAETVTRADIGTSVNDGMFGGSQLSKAGNQSS